MTGAYKKRTKNRITSAYKVHISKAVAKNRAKKAWKTRRKNGTDIPWNKDTKGLQIAWNKGQTKLSNPHVRLNVTRSTRTIRRQFKNGRKQYTHTPEINAKMALAKLGDKNPMRIYPELREKSRQVMLRNLLKMNRPPTDIERILYATLKYLGIKYERNRIILGLTVPDAYLQETMTAIYADGWSHTQPKRRKIDRNQNRVLPSEGYRVLRFNDKQIKSKNFARQLAKRLFGQKRRIK